MCRLKEYRKNTVNLNHVIQHIAYLLLTCRKVEVPTLGCFSMKYESASFNACDGVFYPSRLRVMFSQDSSSDKTLLSESLQRQLQIREEEALSLIKKFADRISKKINQNLYCKIPGIGYLIKDKTGEIRLLDTGRHSESLEALKPVKIG